MKVGGNNNARCFFESQEDYDDSMTLSEKYNSKAAALYRDKVTERKLSGGILYYVQTRPFMTFHVENMSFSIPSFTNSKGCNILFVLHVISNIFKN